MISRFAAVEKSLSSGAESCDVEPGEMNSGSADAIERSARQWVADNCPYQFYFRNVEYCFYSGVLTLRGRVPTFYLKQILQAVLVKLPQVARIDNRVEVVSSVGLSSAGAREAAWD